MRILHVVKTSEGADFAARQVTALVTTGVDAHVVLPSPSGKALPLWTKSGAKLHFANLDFPVRAPWLLGQRLSVAREVVAHIKPDLIHSHFFGPTMVLRYALKKSLIPRIFQVPGPLHLENSFFKAWELSVAGQNDHWISSSHYIDRLYTQAGVASQKKFISYYGLDTHGTSPARSFQLHDRLSIAHSKHIIGNISYMYPPKFYLGQSVGLKCHETLIEALAQVTAARDDVIGVLIGGAWGRSKSYETKLRALAKRKAGNRILMPGFLDRELVASSWADMDIAVHVPLSENCGGVVEPLMAGVPVIASNVGGLPEVIEDHVTGDLVPARSPRALQEKILSVLDDLPRARERALAGQIRVRKLFDIELTAAEVLHIYRKILNGSV